MKTFFLSVLLVFVLILTVPAFAQEEATCPPEKWAEISDTLISLSNDLAAADNPLEQLLLIRTEIETVRAVCSGGVFTKADYPDGIIGPINFGGTLYQATLESVGSVAVLSRVEIDGDCDFVVSIITPFTGGAESGLWKFDECEAMFEIDAASARDWTLTIERLR